MSFKGGFAVKGKWAGNAVKAGKAEEGASAEWELRPCGMLVQKRDPDAEAAHAGPLIRIKVSFGRTSHRVSVNAHSTFGDLKKLLVQVTGLQTEQQRLLYKGKDKSDRDYLSEAGIKDKSKVVLVEDTKGWEKRLVEMRKNDADAKACKVVAEVQQLVDQLSGQIAALEAAIATGKKLSDNDLVGPSDLLMCQLIKLDDSKVDGEAKVQKTILIRRVQKYVETLDALKLRNDSLRVQNGLPKVHEVHANGSPKVHEVHVNGSRKVHEVHANGSPKLHEVHANGRVDAPSPQKKAVSVRTDPKKRANMPVSHNATVVTTTWETFGSSTGGVHAKSAPPPTSEPLLIQWD